MIDGGLGERSGDLLKAVAKHTKVSHPQTAVQHALALGSHGLERAARQGRHEDHRAREHEAVAWRGFLRRTGKTAQYKPRPKIAWPTETFYTNGKLSVRRTKRSATATCPARTRTATSTSSSRRRTCSSPATLFRSAATPFWT